MEWLDFDRLAAPVPSTLFTVLNRIKDAEKDPLYRDTAGPGRAVAGLILPPFQRGLVWDEERMARFVDFARRGIPLGTYTVNDTFGVPALRRSSGEGTFYEMDRWLLDGQQRLTTLERFFSDGLRVHGLVWSQVPPDQQRGFLMSVKFPYVETRFTTEREAAEYYDIMNFGGVAHEADERAVPARPGRH